MKPLDVAKDLEKFQSREHRKYVVALELNAQISALETIIEMNADLVDSPMTYNVVAGLMEQLKYYAAAIFIDSEHSLQKQIDEITTGHGKNRMKPLYGDE